MKAAVDCALLHMVTAERLVGKVESGGLLTGASFQIGPRQTSRCTPSIPSRAYLAGASFFHLRLAMELLVAWKCSFGFARCGIR